MRAVDLIEKTKNGIPLSGEEIAFLVQGFTKGRIPDYQMSAWAMAVRFKGMTPAEIALLTQEMAQSGDQVELSILGEKTVDKHSTGGVGDKTTLILAPIVASLGGTVAKMSGRGLGHTGGTVDKLESIPGYRVELSPEEFIAQVQKIGLAVVGQSGNLAPADKKLYALRDVTATVDSVPLIASSIMSKKLAAGTKSIVLDVKCGSGAFMKTPEAARELAEEMVSIGRSCGRRMAALVTNMDLPLGLAVGNTLEVQEAMEVLQGGGPDDLREVCLNLAAEMLSLALDQSREESRKQAEKVIADGTAFAKMQEWIAAQGGDLRAFEELGEADIIQELKAPESGYITHMDTEKIGLAAMLLGAGRASKEDAIDPLVGLKILKKTGDRAEKGEPLALVYANDEGKLPAAEKCYLQALTFGEAAPETLPLIYERIGGRE